MRETRVQVLTHTVSPPMISDDPINQPGKTFYKKQQICPELQESWKLSRQIFLHIDLYNNRKHEYLFVPVDFHIKTGSVIKSMLYLTLWRHHWFCLLESDSRKVQKTTYCFLFQTHFPYWSPSMIKFSKNNFS